MGAIRRHYLYLDLGFYSACNLTCTYCRDELIRDDRTFGFADLRRQLDAFEERFRAGVVKMSGYGEVTLWRGLPEALDRVHRTYPSVQIITNGTFSKATAELLLRYDNVSPNITIDGHTLELNSTRVGGNRHQHERILRNLELFVRAGRPVEVNCVLHETNVAGFADFCEYLDRLGGDGLIMVFPFPVKAFDRAPDAGPALRSGLHLLADQMDELSERFGHILPPQAYLEDLRKFLRQGRRTDPCHVHWANLGTGSRSERLHCPNYGEELSYGEFVPAVTTGADAVAVEENDHLRAGHVGPGCSSCFNHFDVLSLYLDERLSLDQLCTLPSLRPPGVREVAVALKDEYDRQVRFGLPVIAG